MQGWSRSLLDEGKVKGLHPEQGHMMALYALSERTETTLEGNFVWALEVIVSSQSMIYET